MWSLYTILKKGDKLWKNDKTRERRFELLGVVNYGKNKYMRKNNKR